MAGRPQGGAAPQQNMGQMGNQMQGMRQGMAGMPSQYPGANLAAPGGGMATPAVMPAPQGQGQMFNPGMGPQISQVMPQAPAPQQPPQISQPFPMAPQGGQTMPAPAPAPAPQLPPQYSGSTNPTQLDPSMLIARYQQAMGQQGQGMAPQAPAVMPPQMPQAPQPPISVGASQPYAGVQRPMPQFDSNLAGSAVMPQGAGMMQQKPQPMPMMNDARFQQNPGMTPRPMPRPMPQGRPQVQGNPNAMPVMRNMRGRVR